MMGKKCSICKQELPETSEFFAMRYDRREPRFQGVCRKCQKEYRKKHYEDNKSKYIEKAKRYTDATMLWFQEYRSTLKCSSCRENRWWVLDFHHINPEEKEAEVSYLLRLGSKKNILSEVKKCIVLCANCHRDFHYKQRQAVFV